MNIPEWTGELWQWVLVLLYGGGSLMFIALFACAFIIRPRGYQPIQRKGSPPPREE
jgi:hypothetical protein